MPNTQTSPALMPGGTIGIFGRTCEARMFTLAEIAGFGTKEPATLKDIEITTGIKVGDTKSSLLEAARFLQGNGQPAMHIDKVSLPTGSSKKSPSEIGQTGPSGIGETVELAMRQKASDIYTANLPKNQIKWFCRTVDRKG